MNAVETKESVSRMHEIGESLVEILTLLYNGFTHEKEATIHEAEDLIAHVKEREKKLTEDLVAASENDKTACLLAPIPSHMERIANNLEHIARSIRTKIKDKVLFSPKAVLELNFLLQRTKETLSTTNDLILARNLFLANYIKESEHEIESTAEKFVTLHEERLIEGVCLPKASGLYIVMIDSIKRIVWNAKGIAEKLTKITSF